MDELYSIEAIAAWIQENPGGNDWLLAILGDAERGLARFARDRAMAESEAQDRAEAGRNLYEA